MKAVTAQVMRQLDAVAIERIGIPGAVLMENAGRGAYEMLAAALRRRGGIRVCVLCGPGNNGGDGYVVARHLANNGFRPLIVSTKPGAELAGDAGLNWRIAREMALPMLCLEAGDDVPEAMSSQGPFDAICDALLGTGVSKELKGLYAALVDWANSTDCYRLAVDIPTGVHADTGAILGTAFDADETATFGLPKLGLFLHPGTVNAGKVTTVDISLPRHLTDDAQGVELLDSFGGLPALPPRAPASFKNSHGHLLVVAGSPGKAGAALLAGVGALRSGAGLCTIATHDDARGSLEGRVPDLMVTGWNWDSVSEQELAELVGRKTAIAVGPGLGTSPGARKLVELIFRKLAIPVIADADAINLFAGESDGLRRPGIPTILTPHPGELARLLGLSTGEVQADRLGIAARTAARLQVVVVLKGARTVVAHPDGRLALNLAGTPAMAKAGSGDVLTGVIGALLAMGMAPWDAARLGVYLHARAGEAAQRAISSHGVMASDIAEVLGEVVACCSP